MNVKLAVIAAGLAAALAIAIPSVGFAQAADPGVTTASGNAESLLRDARSARKTAQAVASPEPAIVPFGSFSTPRPGIQHPRVPGIHYILDLSSAFPAGNYGFNRNSLAGGLDAVIFAGPDRYTRLQAGFYTLSEYPIGFDTGTVPSYVLNSAIPVIGQVLGPGRTSCVLLAPLLGHPLPNCPADLHGLQQDATVRNQIFTVGLSRMVYLGGLYPIVITPQYVARTASIGGNNDVFQVYNYDTQTASPVYLRTTQTQSLFVTFPLANSPKLFAAFTIGPQWLVHTAGLNADNHPQIFQLLDIRYFATDRATLFLQPSRLQNYLPSDPYPQRIPTLLTGFSYKFAKPFFVQAFYAGGTPVNPPHGETGRIGIIDVTCIDITTCGTNPNPRTNTALGLGGLKAGTFVLQLGIGTPSVVPL